MAIEMLYFAWVREQIGTGHEVITPSSAVASVADLIDWLAATSDGHARAFADRTRLRAAIDQKFVALDASIAGAREIAIFPPVTGG
ncbi:MULTISPECIES: MoaD/ThiS family protein [unclassified Sphingomonas]|uniref:molybdopterin converting factor subunit 1 n=1 Tax=unclassified Sphingomonas TaxID=196159 RepID=UPI000BC47B3B|nr:MAG: molybdopterin converting factor subunit 1 [Sphingomonas sp. 12-62-6]OYX38901.1 MAG: molybdopterin converting factor subunit 1 [Sphingomonas sp. 32-62-10]OYY64014.1 MAG: molybdopterin converting factor subunit 1 [Sphingomonas sp. 28-62-11]